MTQNIDTLTQRNVWKEWGQAFNVGPISSTIITYLLAALVLVQIGLVGWIYWPQSAASTSSELLFTELEADSVVAITIADDSDNQIALAQNDAGEWILPEAGDFPVTASKVDGLLEKIAEINTSRLVASSESSYGRLSVAEDDFISRVDLTLADGATQTLFIGTAPRTMATHVRSGEGEAVYLASNLRSSDAGAQPRSWIDTQYLQIPSSDISEMSITNSSGDLNFSKTEADEWTIAGLGEGEEFSDSNLVSMVSSISSLNMVEPLGIEALPEYGMDEPNAVVTITALETVIPGGDASTMGEASGFGTATDPANSEEPATETKPKTYTLTIGAQTEDGNNYIVKSSESPYYVEVSSFSVERFIERARGDFVTQVEASSMIDEQAEGVVAAGAMATPLAPFSSLATTENGSVWGPWVQPEAASTTAE